MKHFLNAVRLGFFIAVRQVRRTNRWMTVLTLFIMMLTFLNLVATSGFLVGIVEGSSRAFKEQWTGDLFISNVDKKIDIEKSKEIEHALATFPSVSSFSTRLVRGATVEANWSEIRKEDDINKVSAQVAGIIPSKEDATAGLSKLIVAGSWLADGDQRGIIVGSGLLQEYSRVADLVSLLKYVKVGDALRVTVGSSTQEFIVRGIINSKVQFVSSRVYISDSALRTMAGTDGSNVSEISIKMQAGSDPYLVKSPLVANGYSVGARINTAEEGAPEFLVNIKLFFSIIGTVLGSVSVIVALITIFIIIYINALTRRRQIGIMKGIGVSPFALEFSYICQAIFYVLLGSVVALVIIFGVMKPYIDAHPIITPFADIVLVADGMSVLKKFLLVLLVSAFAGYLPARLIVKQNTLSAILGKN